MLRLKCTKFDFGPQRYSAPPDPLAGFKGALLLRGGEGKGGGGRGKKGSGEGKGKEGEREGVVPPVKIR